MGYGVCVHQLLIRHLHLNDQIASLVENLPALLSTVFNIKVGCSHYCLKFVYWFCSFSCCLNRFPHEFLVRQGQCKAKTQTWLISVLSDLQV